MLQPSDYIADWPDLPYPNFISWLEGSEKKFSNNRAILYRSGKQKEFTVWTYSFYAAECRRIARGLLAQGFAKGDRVALWCENRPEWMAVWIGTVIAGLTIVPIDFTVSEAECTNMLKMAEVSAFFHSRSKAEFASSLSSRGLEPLLLVSMGSEGALNYAKFGSDASGQALPGVDSIAGDDPASIIFTSGTTGIAKGVVLSHHAIIANTNAAILQLRAYDWDVFINVLPLHHTYPTTCSFMAPLTLGSATLIVEKLVGKVVIDDIRDARGTFLIAVPLLYDKVKTALEHGYNALPGVLRGVFDVLRRIALARAKKGRIRFGRVMLWLIRKKASLSSIRMMVAGGGPLNPKTADFFDSFGFNMVHGYGMSENSPLISVSTTWHKNNDSVGLPVKYTSVKILDREEDGTGEIAVKSPSLMLGYYKNPEATREVFTEDGFLRTGDLGYIDEKGFIFINGRKKNLIVSSGGKNIYPEEIEACFEGSRTIGEMIVIGKHEPKDGGEQVFAAIYPNWTLLNEDYKDRELDEEFIKGLIKKEIENVNRNLTSYKKISGFIIVKEEFQKNAQQKIKRYLYKDIAKSF